MSEEVETVMMQEAPEEPAAFIYREPEPKHYRFQFLSGSTLKLIALITMIIDHAGAAILERLMKNLYVLDMPGNHFAFLPAGVLEKLHDYSYVFRLDWNMRMIGRLAFPIYCFLLVEGFRHTHDRRKYAIRLGIFALVSEIPFDLAFMGKISWDHQNVFFTLLIAFLCMCAVRGLEARYRKPEIGRMNWKGVLSTMGIIILAAVIAQVLATDYAALGVLCIMALYGLRSNIFLQSGIGAFLFYMMESFPTVPFAFLPVLFYNGKRGFRMKYFFYAIYPLHLLLLGLLCMWLGI